MNIKGFKYWELINEVEEMTEFVPKSKYFNRLIEAYTKYPDLRPSRDPAKYPNAANIQKSLPAPKHHEEFAKQLDATSGPSSQVKGNRDKLVAPQVKGIPMENNPRDKTMVLSEFVSTRSNLKYSQLLKAIINEWYMWPDTSEAKQALLKYIDNGDDLNNLSLIGTIASDPSLLLGLGAGKKMAVAAGTTATAAVAYKSLMNKNAAVPKVSESVINEVIQGAAVAWFAADFVIYDLISTTWSYVAYGDYEKVQDSGMLSWLSPLLSKDFQGLFGDDPITSTYFAVFNTMMMLIYDAWNLCMGQEKYSSPTSFNQDLNPIRGFGSGGDENYLNSYMSNFCKDDSLKTSFKSFMTTLNVTCSNDMKKPSLFQTCPFYYTGGKVVINFEDDNTKHIRLNQNEFRNWVKSNYTAYRLKGTSSMFEFKATARKHGFRPLWPLGITKDIPGDPLRQISVSVDGTQLKDKKGHKPTLLDLENVLRLKKDSGELSNYKVKYENLSKSETGSTLVLISNDGSESNKEFDSTEKTDRSNIKKGSSIEEIKKGLKDETLSNFSGMGDI